MVRIVPMVVANCVSCGLYAVLEGSCSRVVMGINDVKDGVGPNGVFVVDLIVGSCLFVYMESLNCIHKSAFSGCVEYFHYFVDGTYGVVIVYEVGCKVGLTYIVLEIMEVFFESFLKERPV